jgi:hypothetical protein
MVAAGGWSLSPRDMGAALESVAGVGGTDVGVTRGVFVGGAAVAVGESDVGEDVATVVRVAGSAFPHPAKRNKMSKAMSTLPMRTTMHHLQKPLLSLCHIALGVGLDHKDVERAAIERRAGDDVSFVWMLENRAKHTVRVGFNDLLPEQLPFSIDLDQ